MEEIKIKLLLKAIDGTISFIEFVENGKIKILSYENFKKRFGIDDYKIEDKYNKLLNELKSTREESILKVKEQQLKYLKDNYKDKLNEVDRYAHYLHVGKVGDKLLEPIEAIRITPDIWKNKSRAHTNMFTKGMSAGSLIPLYLYLQSQNQNKTN